MDNEVMELIEQLYAMVSEAWGVPLGNEKCIVERDKILELLDEIKTNLPVELAEAKRLVSVRDQFIEGAKREAEGIRVQAETRARELVNEQEIVQIARTRSSEMLAETEARVQQLRAETEAKVQQLRTATSTFCAESLRQTEETLTAALAGVQKTRGAFRAAVQTTDAPAGDAAGAAPAEEPSGA